MRVIDAEHGFRNTRQVAMPERFARHRANRKSVPIEDDAEKAKFACTPDSVRPIRKPDAPWRSFL